jgi:hypothetical protein
MVSIHKIKKHLPGLLIDESTTGSNSIYQKKRYALNQLERRRPELSNTLIGKIKIAFDELDRAAEQDGFRHIGVDDKGNIVWKTKKR